jgi:hypothetical protein
VEGVLQDEFLACTTDCWTSDAGVAFCSLTVQFINSKFHLVNLPLDCSHFPGSHTGEAIAAKLVAMFERYNLDSEWMAEHVGAAVTDTLGSNVVAARLLPCEWMGCIDHQIELITGLFYKGPGVAAAMKNARKLAGHFNSSTTASEKLAAQCRNSGMDPLAIKQVSIHTLHGTLYLVCYRCYG